MKTIKRFLMFLLIFTLTTSVYGQIVYLPETDENLHKLKGYSAKDMKYGTIVSINNKVTFGTILYYQGTGFHSSDVSLCNDSINYYDSKILGSWITEDKQSIYFFTNVHDGHPFNCIHFRYDSTQKKYFAVVQHLCNATNFDSTYFLEFNNNNAPTSNNKDFFIPSNYSFLDNDHMAIKVISLRYMYDNPDSTVDERSFLLKRFNDTPSYRDFIHRNQNNSDFYVKPFKLTRLKGQVPMAPFAIQNLYRPNYERQKNNTIATALLLLIGAAVLSDGSSSESHTKNFESYNPLVGFDKNFNPIYGNSGRELKYDVYGHPKN